MIELPGQDGNKATKDIILLDSNISITRGDEISSENFSRAVQYRINIEKMTGEEIWSYDRERGKDFYSKIVSDASYLKDTDNRLITSGYISGENKSQ